MKGGEREEIRPSSHVPVSDNRSQAAIRQRLHMSLELGWTDVRMWTSQHQASESEGASEIQGRAGTGTGDGH